MERLAIDNLRSKQRSFPIQITDKPQVSFLQEYARHPLTEGSHALVTISITISDRYNVTLVSIDRRKVTTQ